MSLRITIREGIRTVQRNKVMFMLSVGVTTISLFLLSLFGLISINLFDFVDYLEGKVAILAFVNKDANIEKTIANISRISGVSDVLYISKEEAFHEIQQELGSDARILETFDENPFPPSLLISIEKGYKKGSKLKQIAQKISYFGEVDDVVYGGEEVEKLTKITSTLFLFDILLLAVIFMAILFVIFQTIKITINARWQEIEIMRLVGATEFFIKTPFYFEGLIQGALGGIFSFIFVYILKGIASSQISITFDYRTFILAHVGLGALFGFLGSFLALRRTLI